MSRQADWMRLPKPPPPSSPAARAVMQANRGRDTQPELTLRRRLHALGLRYRVDHPVRPDQGRAIRVDVAFPKARLAVFVDGCFWHGCPDHGTWPKANSDFWLAKIRRNQARDLRDRRRLEEAGWRVIRIWEHDAAVGDRDVYDALRSYLDPR